MQRYRSFTGYFIRKYGTRLQKVVIDAGFSCPNRDGTVGAGGCTYCDNRAFHPGYSTPDKSITQQIDEGIESIGSDIVAQEVILLIFNHSATRMHPWNA
jgi:radical SAM superfamily enzyme